MAHTTSVYYRDRLGFEPDYEPHRQSSQAQQHYVGTQVGNGKMEDPLSGGIYEENLSKFKGLYTPMQQLSSDLTPTTVE